jgi:hypothetical protein
VKNNLYNYICTILFLGMNYTYAQKRPLDQDATHDQALIQPAKSLKTNLRIIPETTIQIQQRMQEYPQLNLDKFQELIPRPADGQKIRFLGQTSPITNLIWLNNETAVYQSGNEMRIYNTRTGQIYVLRGYESSMNKTVHNEDISFFITYNLHSHDIILWKLKELIALRLPITDRIDDVIIADNNIIIVQTSNGPKKFLIERKEIKELPLFAEKGAQSAQENCSREEEILIKCITNLNTQEKLLANTQFTWLLVNQALDMLRSWYVATWNKIKAHNYLQHIENSQAYKKLMTHVNGAQKIIIEEVSAILCMSCEEYKKNYPQPMQDDMKGAPYNLNHRPAAAAAAGAGAGRVEPADISKKTNDRNTHDKEKGKNQINLEKNIDVLIDLSKNNLYRLTFVLLALEDLKSFYYETGDQDEAKRYFVQITSAPIFNEWISSHKDKSYMNKICDLLKVSRLEEQLLQSMQDDKPSRELATTTAITTGARIDMINLLQDSSSDSKQEIEHRIFLENKLQDCIKQLDRSGSIFDILEAIKALYLENWDQKQAYSYLQKIEATAAYKKLFAHAHNSPECDYMVDLKKLLRMSQQEYITSKTSRMQDDAKESSRKSPSVAAGDGSPVIARKAVKENEQKENESKNLPEVYLNEAREQIVIAIASLKDIFNWKLLTPNQKFQLYNRALNKIEARFWIDRDELALIAQVEIVINLIKPNQDAHLLDQQDLKRLKDYIRDLYSLPQMQSQAAIVKLKIDKEMILAELSKKLAAIQQLMLHAPDREQLHKIEKISGATDFEFESGVSLAGLNVALPIVRFRTIEILNLEKEIQEKERKIKELIFKYRDALDEANKKAK